MATPSTRARLLEAAEHAFAERGFSGASVRQITSAAGCDLGSVRYHFGTKDALFAEVLQARLAPLCAERLRRLEEVEGEPSDSRHLERLIEAFVFPAVELVTDPEFGPRCAKIIAWARVEPQAYLEIGREIYSEMQERFLDAFQRALPDLPAREVKCRFVFLFGAQANTLIDSIRLPGVDLGLPPVLEDPWPLFSRLVQFAAAGMRAPLDIEALETDERERSRT